MHTLLAIHSVHCGITTNRDGYQRKMTATHVNCIYDTGCTKYQYCEYCQL